MRRVPVHCGSGLRGSASRWGSTQRRREYCRGRPRTRTRPVAFGRIAVGMSIDAELICQMADAPSLRSVEAYAVLRQGRDRDAAAMVAHCKDDLSRLIRATCSARAGEGLGGLERILETVEDTWIRGLTRLQLAVQLYRGGDLRRAAESAEWAVGILDRSPASAPSDVGRACLIAAAAYERLGNSSAQRNAAAFGLQRVGDRPPAAELRVLHDRA